MMEVSPAPLFEDVASGPVGGMAHWLTTRDGKRIRVAHWLPEGTARGTVMLFPGRTEYIEKYGESVKEFTSRQFAGLSIDWRGQGLADRLLPDPRIGHVEQFTDFQHDVRSTLAVGPTTGSANALVCPWPLDGRCHRAARGT